jgi:hypothetical protein
MRIPKELPAARSERTASGNHRPEIDARGHLAPAACCAEACVNIPFVGRVCHCVLDLPVCP